MKNKCNWSMALLSIALLLTCCGCSYHGNICSIVISKEKDCKENITNAYLEYGFLNQESRRLEEGIVVKVGDITTEPSIVKCSFEKKQGHNERILYCVDIYYQQDGQWMTARFFCGDGKRGNDSNKVSVSISSFGIHKFAHFFLAKTLFRYSQIIIKPKFMIEPHNN